MTYDHFVQQMAQGKLSPIYLLVGSEDFLKQEALTTLMETILDPSSREFNLDRFYGADADPGAVVDAALAFPVLAPKRLVILREVDKLSENGLQVLLPLFERPPESTCLVLTADKIDGWRKTLGILKRRSETVECTPLYENQVPRWIQRRVEGAGKRISPEAVDLLVSRVGTSLSELANELQKLFLFVADRERIEATHVGEVVGMSRTDDVFELADAIGRKEASRAICIADRMLEEGEKPTRMVAMILRHLGIMLKIKAYHKTKTSPKGLASKVGVSPYFLKGYVAQSQGFSLDMLAEGIQHLREADSNLKGGYQNDRTIMELLIYRLCTS